MWSQLVSRFLSLHKLKKAECQSTDADESVARPQYFNSHLDRVWYTCRLRLSLSQSERCACEAQRLGSRQLVLQEDDNLGRGFKWMPWIPLNELGKVVEIATSLRTLLQIPASMKRGCDVWSGPFDLARLSEQSFCYHSGKSALVTQTQNPFMPKSQALVVDLQVSISMNAFSVGSRNLEINSRSIRMIPGKADSWTVTLADHLNDFAQIWTRTCNPLILTDSHQYI
jgi:hypothetical protein